MQVIATKRQMHPDQLEKDGYRDPSSESQAQKEEVML